MAEIEDKLLREVARMVADWWDSGEMDLDVARRLIEHISDNLCQMGCHRNR
jgi:hypothetical protein